MDHPFLTRRHDLKRALEGLSLAGDVKTLCKMTASDHSHVSSFSHRKVSDASIREVLDRRLGGIGLMLVDLDDAAGTVLDKEHGNAWKRFLQSHTSLPAKALSDLERAVEKLTSVEKETRTVEDDDDDSSYSDYSDSRTVSTDDEDSYDDTDGKSEESR